ncbi:MAG TPA: OmpA family protein [Gemmatimonadales bacterium]|nr:OmpA family protein [Gemmatimonadales bacterium]
MRSSKVPYAFLLLTLVGATAATTPAEAQFGGLGRKLKQKAQQKIDQKEDAAAQKAVDSADDAVTCAATDKKCQADAKAAGKEVVTSEGGAAEAGAGGAADAGTPGKGAFVNYDFKPGERPIFVDDFTKDEVGDFPRRLELESGNFEVAEWQGKRLLRATAFGGFYVPLPETLPQRFTVEFDFAGPSGWSSELEFSPDRNVTQSSVEFNPHSSGVSGPVRAISETGQELVNKLAPVRVMVDGKYVKVYHGTKRVANVPNATVVRSNKLYFRISASEDSPVFIGNLRVMAGGKKLYDALAESGRVATQGIYFDTGSDVIRGESTPTLKEIGTMLKEHPDLKLTIEGHTDNVGSAASNLTLSQARADAVKAALTSDYGVSADQMTARGFGDTKPVAKNTTPEGRANNRRVEIVKL